MTKCRGLTAEGMTAHHWCGSYSLPAATITGSVRREVCWADLLASLSRCWCTEIYGPQTDVHSKHHNGRLS